MAAVPTKKPKTWTSERVAKYLANPGLRKYLPDKYLSPEQRRVRHENERLRQPIVPGSPTTERDLARSRKAAEKVEFGPSLDALAKARKDLDTQRVRDDGYFRDYKEAVHQAAERQSRMAEAANTAAQNVAQTASQDSGKAIDAATTAAAQDAAKQGVSFNEAAFRDVAQRAAAGRTALAQNQVADAGRGGVAQGALLSMLEGGAIQAQGRRTKQLDDAGAELVKKASDLRDKRSAWRDKYDSTSREDAWKRVLEAKAFGLKEQTAKSSAAAAKRRDATTRRGQDINDANADATRDAKANTPNQYGYLPAEWAALPTKTRQAIILKFKKTGKGKGNSGSGSKPTEAESKAWKSTQSAVNWLQRNYGKTVEIQPPQAADGTIPPKVKKYLNLHQIHQMPPEDLAQLINVNSPEYLAAVDLFTSGGKGISQATADRLHRADIKVRGRYKVIPTAQFRAIAKQRQGNQYR